MNKAQQLVKLVIRGAPNTEYFINIEGQLGRIKALMEPIVICCYLCTGELGSFQSQFDRL